MTDEGKHDGDTTGGGFHPLHDVALAITFLTRLPLPLNYGRGRSLSQASWAFPFAGILSGGVGGSILLGGLLIGIPDLIAVLLGLAAATLVTGALHEDGLADVADGFGGGVSRDKKLEIMHDSRIGSYGVLALVFCVGLRVAALTMIAGQGGPQFVFATFLASGVLSRGLLPVLMAALPNARSDGLSHGAGRPSAPAAMAALVFGVIGAGGVFHPDCLVAVYPGVAAGAAVFAFAIIARRQIGGQTGDVIGAAQQVGETAFLVTLTVVMGGSL